MWMFRNIKVKVINKKGRKFYKNVVEQRKTYTNIFYFENILNKIPEVFGTIKQIYPYYYETKTS